MNASYEWLCEMIGREPYADLSPNDLRDLITSRCATVDDVIPLREDLAGIVVARVVEATRHPGSDHLSVTRVDAGGGELVDVVCGAPNVRAGALYPFAPVGAVLPGGLKIEKRKIRGATSEGMLCSARELVLGSDHEGIMELTVNAAPGTPLLRAMPLGDARLVIDVMPNRPDLLSHLGIAREIAAALGHPLAAEDAHRRPDAATAVSTATAGGMHSAVVVGVRVSIADTDGCQRYIGAVIRGVTIAQSPDWLVRRLVAVGLRPINNVVDITNYMLHGFGQPMHAFDLAKLDGPEIVVRRAGDGERLTTLDGVDRRLDPSMTVIADASRAHAVAGVMGGADSEVTASTADILLEVAAFDAVRVRATRRSIGLSTDASYRFERGTDVDAAASRTRQAVDLFEKIAGGRLSGSPADVYPAPATPTRLTLRPARVLRLLGESVGTDEITSLLRPIGFSITDAPPDAHGVPLPAAAAAPAAGAESAPALLRVTVPSWRRDIEREVDLIEEVARLRGYDSFSSELRPFRPGAVPDDPMWSRADHIRGALIAEGILETRAMPFVRGHETGFVRVTNPLAENEAYLRRDLLDTLARRAEFNLSHMQGDVRLFEIGATFTPGGRRGLPVEEMHAALLVMGRRRPVHFTEPVPPAFDAWDARGLAERLARAAFPGAAIGTEPRAGGNANRDSGRRAAGKGDDAVLWDVLVDGRRVGHVSRVALDAPVWASPAFGVELALATIESAPVAARGRSLRATAPEPGRELARGQQRGDAGEERPRFQPLPSTPAVEIDIALLVPDAVPAAAVDTLLRSTSGTLLERLELFDEYRGPGVPDGHRSLAWRLTFRHPERTLRDREIEGRREKLLRQLEDELGVRQRTS